MIYLREVNVKLAGLEVYLHSFLPSALDEVCGSITPRPLYPLEMLKSMGLAFVTNFFFSVRIPP